MPSIKKCALALGGITGLLSAALLSEAHVLKSAPQEQSIQTLVFLRHAEKPAEGLGQLNCQGLNRAISLSHMLPERFGAAHYIFAANPTRKVEEGPKDESYHYIRPLMTIAPTAIRLGLPINIEFEADEVDDFVDEILESKYRDKTIYTAWSRGYLPDVINELLSETKADSNLNVGHWSRDDFDSIFMVKLHWNGHGKPSVTLLDSDQKLDGGERDCPTPEVSQSGLSIDSEA
ncbi:hypothetical protein LX59_01825 [Azomonas agilis]|uniref:Broad specificity phosphatase PhoE n=1 Tax=Azomonas agilis TaxID=116849 RepID=A0A562I2F2_9GAMM|nr:hypothetical protein LX59_01825 [Azomonas agilis]